jgi:hypothetical protein
MRFQPFSFLLIVNSMFVFMEGCNFFTQWLGNESAEACWQGREWLPSPLLVPGWKMRELEALRKAVTLARGWQKYLDAQSTTAAMQNAEQLVHTAMRMQAADDRLQRELR